MSKRFDKTLADYLVIAVSPALIMTLIASLVFFLLEVFYQGNFTGRLYYILTLFIFAAVLIGRIAIEQGKERAALFAIPVALCAVASINRYVDFRGALASFSFVINCGLIALIWWCAHKLTWDCTMIDESEPSSGEGLLDAAGLGERAKSARSKVRAAISGLFDQVLITLGRDGRGSPSSPQVSGRSTPPTDRLTESGEHGSTQDGDPRPPGRWNNWREPRGKPHAPGVWIVYFSLAALPIFGLGQLAIPAAQAGQRRYAFCLLAVYVASGLGLLLTTSFLGLRRYLRQRRLPMPGLMANTWIVLGCLLIVAVMGLALFVPRPSAEFAVSRLPNVVGSPDQRPSKFGMGRDGVKSDEGRPTSDENNTDAGRTKPGNGPAKSGSNGDSKKPQATEPRPGGDSRKSQAGRNEPNKGPPLKGSSGTAEKSQQKADDKAAKKPSSSERPKQNSPSRPEKPPENPPAEPGKGEDRKGNDGEQSKPQSQSKSGSQPEESREAGSRQPTADSSPANPAPPAMPDVSAAFEWLLPFLQIAFYVIVAAIGAYWAWRHRAEILAVLQSMFSGLRLFWEQFLRRGSKAAQGASAAGAVPPPSRPFADFADPFATGLADRVSPDRLVQYSFEALEAWARENGCPRDPEQTPHEFADSVGRRAAVLQRAVLRLADLYGMAAYAPGRLELRSMKPLEDMWQGLRSVSDNLPARVY